jgi:hypothetical protein
MNTIWQKPGDHDKVKDYSDITPEPGKICKVCDKPYGAHGLLADGPTDTNGYIICPGMEIKEVGHPLYSPDMEKLYSVPA